MISFLVNCNIPNTWFEKLTLFSLFWPKVNVKSIFNCFVLFYYLSGTTSYHILTLLLPTIATSHNLIIKNMDKIWAEQIYRFWIVEWEVIIVCCAVGKSRPSVVVLKRLVECMAEGPFTVRQRLRQRQRNKWIPLMCSKL